MLEFDGILLKPCLLQPCFHVAGLLINIEYNDNNLRKVAGGRLPAIIIYNDNNILTIAGSIAEQV